MQRHHLDETTHRMRTDPSPRDLLISLLEMEGDVFGWDAELLIYEASLRLDGSPEESSRAARMALHRLLRDGVAVRKDGLVRLRD
jgi:hypothetical protein